MRFETSQNMRLSQQMRLAPRMIQSMEILQLPMLALQERISQELEGNVALEQVDSSPDTESDADASTIAAPSEEESDASDDRLDSAPLKVGEDSPGSRDDWQRLSVLESSYKEGFDHEDASPTFSTSRQRGERDRKMDAMANVAARPESLTDQLLHQWSFAEVDADTAALGARLITYINDDGLMGADLATIADQTRHVPGVEATLERLEAALKVVQRWLEPPGIGARDNRECFLLQIDALENGDEDAEHDWDTVRMLIKDHYDDLLQNRLPRIAQKTTLPMERLNACLDLMKKLKINPGRDLVSVDVPPVIPDVIVEYDDQSDAYVAALTDGLLPTLRVSPRYEAMAKDRTVEAPTREFVGNNVRNAQWLIESINQRKNTLLRVVNVVLARQREYFDYGSQFLKPMPMIDVADQLGVHVATVSRAVADKWLQTPRGIVPLRKFFSGGTESSTGRDMSWEAVKAALKDIVQAEDRTRPMSDDALAAELNSRLGVEIARRTVVKYRQQLDIPPARRRKVH